MNNSIIRFSLNIQETASQSFIAVKRGDTARRLEITLTDGGKPYEIQSDCAAVFSAVKPDDSIIYNACSIENNKIIYNFTEQTVALVGTIPVEIKLYGGDGGLITSPCFLMIVEGVVFGKDEDIESTEEFSALTEAMSRVEAAIDEIDGYQGKLDDLGERTDNLTEAVDELTERVAEAEETVKNFKIDDTLTVPGGAADAKVTGDMIRQNISDISANTSSIAKNKSSIEGLDTDVEELKKNVADLMYEPIAVTGFANSVNTVEIGQTITAVTLSWTFNKAPATVTIDGESQSAAQSGSLALTGLTLTSDKTWTLQGTDERDAVASKTTKISFLNGVYYGALASFDGDISQLTRVLTSTRARTVTVTADAGKYIWYVSPTRLGACSFKVGGFDGGFEGTTMEITNASGYTETYNVYKTTNAGLGKTTVTVS